MRRAIVSGIVIGSLITVLEVFANVSRAQFPRFYSGELRAGSQYKAITSVRLRSLRAPHGSKRIKERKEIIKQMRGIMFNGPGFWWDLKCLRKVKEVIFVQYPQRFTQFILSIEHADLTVFDSG